MLQPQPPQSRFERVAGQIQGHQCKAPGAVARFFRRVRVGDIWVCACAQRWRWGRHPLAVAFDIHANEWVRL